MEDIKVQIRFTIDKDGLSYTDALYYTLSEYAQLTEAEKDAEKQARFDTFKAAVTTPSQEVQK